MDPTPTPSLDPPAFPTYDLVVALATVVAKNLTPGGYHFVDDSGEVGHISYDDACKSFENGVPPGATGEWATCLQCEAEARTNWAVPGDVDKDPSEIIQHAAGCDVGNILLGAVDWLRFYAADCVTADIARLRKIADAATPGPWKVLHGVPPYGRPDDVFVGEASGVSLWNDRGEMHRREDAEFIATFDPSTIKKLLGLLP